MNRFVFAASGLLLCWISNSASAHEMRPGYLEINQVDERTYDVFWKVPRTGGMKLNIQPTFSENFEETSPVVQKLLGDAVVEQWRATSALPLPGQSIRVEGLERTLTDVLVRISYSDGSSITHRLTASAPNFEIPTQPSRWSVATTYSVLGVEHILLGIDHLLFVLVLLLIVDGKLKLIKTVTAFTIAHSITLTMATLNLVHVPGPPVEAVIALSIVFVASEIVKKQDRRAGLTERQPWVVAFSFGLLHGFGFAGALSEIGLPSSELPMALLTFNIGVEIGQLVFVFAFLIAWRLIRFLPTKWPNWTPRVLPYAIGSVAAFWVIQRTAGF